MTAWRFGDNFRGKSKRLLGGCKAFTAWAVMAPLKETGVSDTGGLAGHLMLSVRHLEFTEKVTIIYSDYIVSAFSI